MALKRPADAHAAFERFFNAADIEGLVSLYEPDARLVLPEGEVVGHDAIRIALGNLLALHGAMRMETVGVVEHADLALTSSTWRLEGSNGQFVQGESIEILRRHPEGWLAAIDCPFGVG